VYPQADGQAKASLARQMPVHLCDRLEDPEPRIHGPLGVILMRAGIAEVDQDAVAEVFGDVPVEALDHLCTGIQIGAHDVTELFGVELAGEGGGVH
jgi:hypothetical protein